MKSINFILVYVFIGFAQLQAADRCAELEMAVQKAKEEGRESLVLRYKLLGDCYLGEGEQEKALFAYKKTLIFPYKSLTTEEHVQVAESLVQLDQEELALAEVKKILQHDPESKQAAKLLAQLKGAGEKKPAVETNVCRQQQFHIQEAEESGRTERLPLLYKEMGDCYAVANNVDEAVSAYEKALSFPFEALYIPARLEIAEYLGNIGQYDKSLSVLHQILTHDPENIRAQLLIARFLLWKGEPAEAEDYVDPVLDEDPTSIQARLIKGGILLKLGKTKRAVRFFQQLLAQNELTQEEEFEARSGLIAAYISLKHYTLAEVQWPYLEAKASYQERIKQHLSKELEEAKTRLPEKEPAEVPPVEVPLREEEPPAAEVPVPEKPSVEVPVRVEEPPAAETPPEKEAVPKPPPEEKEVLCENYLEKIQTAKREANRDELAPLYKDLGDCYQNNLRRDLAADAYEQAFSFPYKNLTINQRIEMAAFLGNQDRYDIAIAELGKILRREPENQKVLILIARFYSWRGEEGDQKEAEKYIDQVLAKDPDNTEARIIKANVLTYTKRSEEAIVMYHELLKEKTFLGPEEIFWVRFGLAFAYFNQEEYALAEMQLTLIDAEFPYQETKIAQLRKRIKEAKENKPKKLKAEWDKYLTEKIKFANQLLNNRCFFAGMFELYEVLRCDPCNLYGRLIYARGLGLMGYYCDALRQLNMILRIDPCNIDAWIFRGMILRWKADVPGSTSAFLRALRIDDDNFDARTGLAWTDISRGDQVDAYELVATTSICESYQVQEISDLYWELALGPNFGFDYSRYEDSDEILTEDYYLDANGYYKDYRINLLYHHVYASQPVDEEQGIEVVQRVDAGYLNVTRFVNASIDVGGGIGYASSTERDSLLGNVFLNYRTHCGNFALASAYDVYTGTAAAIFFHIRTWANSINYYNVLSGWLTVGGNYIYTYFSDSNHSNRIDLWAEYKLVRTPCWNIVLEYRFRYWDFADQIVSPFVVPGIFGGHGYFNPFDYYANQLGISFILSTKRLDILLHPYIAYLTYEQSGRHNGLIYAGNLEVEYRFTKNFSASFGFEAGDYQLKDLEYDYTVISAGLNWYY